MKFLTKYGKVEAYKHWKKVQESKLSPYLFEFEPKVLFWAIEACAVHDFGP